MTELFRFAAFISYSSKDARFAAKLHRALETFKIPASLGRFDLTGGGRKNRVFPVFRDREELPSGDIGLAIEAALKASNALIVICSPNAAESPWVNKEIESFLAQGRRDRIFAIIHPDAPYADDLRRDGTHLSFPLALRSAGLEGGLALIAGDARNRKDGFRNAWLKVVAGVIGVNAGALQDRDRKRRSARRVQIGLGTSASAMAIGLFGAALDARDWRTDLSQRANAVLREGLTSEAATLALGGVDAPFAILPWRNEAADALAQQTNAVRLIVDAGSAWQAFLSANGATLLVEQEDIGGNAVVHDLKTRATKDFGPVYKTQLSGDGAVLAIQRADAERTGAVYDLKSGGKTELGPVLALELSADGAVIAFERPGEQREGIVYNLQTKTEVGIGSLRMMMNMRLSANGGILLIQRRETLPSSVLNLKTGAELDLGPLLLFQLSVDGDVLLVIRNAEPRTGAVYDLTTGAITELGPVTRAQISDDGAVVAFERYKHTTAVYNLRTGAKIELGQLDNFVLSVDGASLLLHRVDAPRTAAVLDLRSGALTEIGEFGELMDLAFTRNGGVAFVTRQDLVRSGALYDLKSGAIAEFGPVQAFVLTEDGATLSIRRPHDRQSVAAFDLSRPMPIDGKTGHELARAVCDAHGHALRPFNPLYRDPARIKANANTSAAELRTYAVLRGRPWNPCDWRGLLAIRPDPERGDLWFEGVRQWWRLMAVRHFRAPDWACAETLGGALDRQKADRSEMCRLYAPDAKD